MHIRIADTFTASLARRNGQEQTVAVATCRLETPHFDVLSGAAYVSAYANRNVFP